MTYTDTKDKATTDYRLIKRLWDGGLVYHIQRRSVSAVNTAFYSWETIFKTENQLEMVEAWAFLKNAKGLVEVIDERTF